MFNLLDQAHQLIPYQQADYFAFKGNTVDSNTRLDVPQYAEGITVNVKINAVKSSLMKKLGLDYKKNYVKLYSTPTASGLTRVSDGDQFEFDSKRWQIEVQTGWFATAGWDSYVMIEVEFP